MSYKRNIHHGEDHTVQHDTPSLREEVPNGYVFLVALTSRDIKKHNTFEISKIYPVEKTKRIQTMGYSFDDKKQ